jgi:hypothetical protein
MTYLGCRQSQQCFQFFYFFILFLYTCTCFAPEVSERLGEVEWSGVEWGGVGLGGVG